VKTIFVGDLERRIWRWWREFELVNINKFIAVWAVLLIAGSAYVFGALPCDTECQKRNFAEELLRCENIAQPKTKIDALTFGMRQIKEAQKCVDDLMLSMRRFQESKKN
jgi:hypothetical protein